MQLEDCLDLHRKPAWQFGHADGRAGMLAEFGAEVRWRVWGDIGVVPFIEGGQVFESELPEIGNGLRWGAGLGLRYFTAVGPLRVDFAVPLQRRRDIDDAFQFYISLGQAF